MSTKTVDDLHAQIEHLVREHLAAQRRAAMTAVERAFEAVAARPPVKPARQSTGRRRPPAEVAELAERLHEVVRAHPGETMTAIAAQVGQTPRALNRPMLQLKKAGRIRSAGQRHFTRYFPMASTSAKAA